MRRLILAGATGLAVVSVGPPAWAGAAVWHFEGYHQPGDIVESTTTVAWDHSSDLGTPEDGPYFVYLAEDDVPADSWPAIPEDALLVGIVEVRLGPVSSGREAFSLGPNHAIARFEIPDVAAGTYQGFHCNDRCTTTLGDIIGGWDVRVSSGPHVGPADEVAADVRAMALSMPLVFEAEPGLGLAASALDSGSSEPAAVGAPMAFTTTWIVAVALMGAGIVVGMVRSNLRSWHGSG
jgi:hypothetical protein